MQTPHQEHPQDSFPDERLPADRSGNRRTWRFTALRDCTYPVGNRTVYCILYRIDCPPAAGGIPQADASPVRYAIGMDSGREQALCLLNRALHPAERVFELLIRHAVTPCTLSDVLEDMAPAP